MASVVYTEFKRANAAAEIDLNADDIRVALLMTNTTADTEEDTALMNAFTTIDECDATGYARVALTGEAVTADNTNDRAEFDADDASFTGLSGDATRDIQGVLVYKHVTNDTDSIPICFVDFSADVTKFATQIDIPWNAEGILQLT
ncbi:hypothetical protein CMI37_15005 [Candidatus Pacearchaeota archaeon]|nr:hypothetical protein [Candidatus Pacearchaeota archaeon]